MAQHEETQDTQQWEVVGKPASEPNPAPESETTVHGRATSSHFDLKIGWGKYKLTLLSWDINTKNSTTEKEA
ncbi:hypothetical protein QBC47DRAFT_54411 [Echria macrotheca]|uniref:Uncharacterized protein n=1 Tax=Echria macrotheca TaxID=438768 RepID=A0AAJ0F9K9_9PEZI|nr:hypothetical protein QBC47DRAFT_54411 [Echria macrotheca]